MTTTYHFKIHTGDELYAGTDSNIFVKLYGDGGPNQDEKSNAKVSEEIRLNGNISGNAFERNKTDEFDIKINDDIGDIYFIKLRSDCLYGGSDWLLSYIEVEKDGSKITSKFTYDKWIENKDPIDLRVISGYPLEIPNPQLNSTTYDGGVHSIVPGSTEEFKMKGVVINTIDYSEVTCTKVGVTTKVDFPLEAFKLGVESSIESTFEQSFGIQYNSTTETETIVKIDSPKKPRKITEQWIIDEYDYNVTFNNLSFKFSVPKCKRFGGFVEKDSPNEKVGFSIISEKKNISLN